MFVTHDLFVQVPSITKKESNSLDQSHQDENGDEDELVVVWQGMILVRRKFDNYNNEYLFNKLDLNEY